MLMTLLAVFPSLGLACEAWCNSWTCNMAQCSGCGVCADIRYDDHCAWWCNAWTCGPGLVGSYCDGCNVCKRVSHNIHCESWCNEHTCGDPMCTGCVACGGNGPSHKVSAVCTSYPHTASTPHASAGSSPCTHQHCLHRHPRPCFDVGEHVRLWERARRGVLQITNHELALLQLAGRRPFFCGR